MTDIVYELDHQTDRGAALIASAVVDVSLGKAIRCKFVGYQDVEQIMFEKEGAPLATFFSRIRIARALGIIGPLTESHLDSMRRIRNQFAHSALRIDFTNGLIAAEVDKLLEDTNPSWKPEFSVQRRRFVGTAILLIQAFEARVQEHLADKIDVWLT